MRWRRLDNNRISRKPIFMIDQFIQRAAYVGLRYGRPLQFFLADFPSGVHVEHLLSLVLGRSPSYLLAKYERRLFCH